MVLPQAMRAKYQWALGAAPIGLMFASLLPLYLFADWLAAALGMNPDDPVRSHPNGTTWGLVFLVAFLVAMLLGYALGWLLNAAVSRFVLGWPPEKVRAVYLRSDVPPEWLKTAPGSVEDAASLSLAKWEEQRKVGAARFILTRGVLAWGAPMFVTFFALPAFLKNQPVALESILFNTVLWAVGGAAFGAAIWYASERNYRKAKARQ